MIQGLASYPPDFSSNNPLRDELHCDDPEEFLSFLTPHLNALKVGRHHPIYGRGGRLDDWIYRGQGDARWCLLPSAHRPNGLFKFSNPTNLDDQYEIREREFKMVRDFCEEIERAGLEIPHDFPEMRDQDAIHKYNVAHQFPDAKLRGMFALAQHYGVPTRLLDWSRQPLYAAYFAAITATQCPEKDGKQTRLAVWVLNWRFTRRQAARWNPGPILVTVPTVSNPNLHAQQAAFTLVRSTAHWTDTLRALDCGGSQQQYCPIPPLDWLFQQHTCAEINTEGSDIPKWPMLFKVTLPRSQACRLLYLLDAADVHAAALFPGHAGVVRRMREKKLHQRFS